MIAKYEMDRFFERLPDEKRYGGPGGHFLMRPRGFEWTKPDQQELPAVLAQWRADYRKLPVNRQLMVATVLQLYRQGEDKWWMVRVPKAWHASEGVASLKAAGMLGDWARLYTAYAGW